MSMEKIWQASSGTLEEFIFCRLVECQSGIGGPGQQGSW